MIDGKGVIGACPLIHINKVDKKFNRVSIFYVKIVYYPTR